MAIKGIFVGINKYSNPGIPELSGARPDVKECTFKCVVPVELAPVDRRSQDNQIRSRAPRPELPLDRIHRVAP
jgi:hypothetical protein